MRSLGDGATYIKRRQLKARSSLVLGVAGKGGKSVEGVGRGRRGANNYISTPPRNGSRSFTLKVAHHVTLFTSGLVHFRFTFGFDLLFYYIVIFYCIYYT